MTGWIIFIIILVLIVFLLFCPVTVFVGFENELSASIKYLFFHYNIVPDLKEQPKEEKLEEEKKIDKTKKKSKIKGIIEQKGLSGFLNIIKEFSLILADTAKFLISRIKIKNFYINIIVADEDAANTAIKYGNTCSVIYTAAGWILNNIKYSRYYINIVPDFEAKKNKIKFELKVSIKLIFILLIMFSALFKSIKLLKTSEINLSKI